MSTDWRRVRQIVESALEQRADRRDGFVAAECGGDALLRERVMRLLAEDEGAEDYPVPPGGQVFADGGAPPAPATERRPRRLGPWELRRELGVGGMGSVYLAVRADGQFQRQVAIKLIRHGLDHGEVLARFHRERQVQANLDHPGIARMLDAGVAEGGEPYLVLEYVDGIPIDRHCDENRLSPEERIRLFRKVCDAVHHAHQNLVVHRDLKPNNILVTPGGEPKLLDFGIAKVLDPEKAAGREVTQAVVRFMTPTYASPEQIRNRPVTTSSDVYSLGVILYQLLTGHPPLELGTSTPAEIERVVCEVDPPRPSTIVTRSRDLPPTKARGSTTRVTPALVSSQRLTTPRGLVRLLSGDLDSIVLMAMRKEPHRRYGSAAGLSEDLRRYLAGLPVVAQPDTALYRGLKFARRNKLAVLTAVILVASLVSGLVLARRAQQAESAQRRLAEDGAQQLGRLAADLAREKDLAEERAERMRSLALELEQEKQVAQQRLEDVRAFSTTLIFDIGQKISPLEGSIPALQVLCETGVQFLDKLQRDAGEDTAFLRSLAIAYGRLGDVQAFAENARPGGSDVGRVLASFQKGVDVASRALELGPADPQNAFALATCLTYRGRMLDSLWRRGEAEQSLRAAIDVCEDVIGPAAEPLIGHLFCWWNAIERLGHNLQAQQRFAEADQLLETAEPVLERLLARWPTFPAVRSAQVAQAAWQGRAALRRGEQDLAVDFALQAVELQESLARDQPSPEALRVLWETRFALLDAQGVSADLQEGIEIAQGAQRYYVEAIATDPGHAEARFGQIEAVLRRAAYHLRAGELDGGRAAAAEARGLARSELELHPEDPVPRFLLAGALLQAAEVELRFGELSEANGLATEARALLEEALRGEEERLPGLQAVWRAQALLGRIALALARDEGGTSAQRRSAAQRAAEWLTASLATLAALEEYGPVIDPGPSELDRMRADLDAAVTLELAFD